jgi:hypothetical protein
MTFRAASACCALLLLVPAAQPGLESKTADVQLEMKNVRLHVDDGIVLEIRRLRGEMVSKGNGPPVFDDRHSYALHLSSGEIAMEMASLQALLNRHLFAYEGSPLKDIAVEADGPRIRLKGKLRKGVDVPFSTIASVSTTADGRLRLRTESMKALGIPAKGLLDLFGLELDDVVGIKERRGVDVQENDIIISAGQVLPPPEIVGRLAKVAVQGRRLVQTFEDGSRGRPPRLTPPSPSARNYIYFGGGDITFGKLTMHQADLQLIDLDPRDAFDFYPARYNGQLVAGYSKNTPDKGLKTFMPDFDDLRQSRADSPSARSGGR